MKSYFVNIDPFNGKKYVDIKRFIDDAKTSDLSASVEVSENSVVTYDQRERTQTDRPITPAEFNYYYRCLRNATEYRERTGILQSREIVNVCAVSLLLFAQSKQPTQTQNQTSTPTPEPTTQATAPADDVFLSDDDFPDDFPTDNGIQTDDGIPFPRFPQLDDDEVNRLLAIDKDFYI